MTKVPPIPSEFFTKFDSVKFHDEPHKYYVNGKVLTSVTTIIHKYEEEFDEEYWSLMKSTDKMSSEKVKDTWDFMNRMATVKGSIIHNTAEYLFQNKIYEYPKKWVLNEFGFDPIYHEYKKTKKLLENFYNHTKGKLIPIKAEFVVHDDEYGIGGMVDLLVYNVKAKEFQIWDWKTNKEFTTESDRKLSGILGILDDCHHELYSLQLNAYKYIIERSTGLKIGRSYLVWLYHGNDNYQIFETKNRMFYIKKMFEEFKNAV